MSRMNKYKKEYVWDAFISHASEDKNEVVLPLCKLLTENGMKVWVDKHQLLLGDSLRRSIDKGLSLSRFGIVILSKSFFKKEWPKKELDALVSREDGKEKVILPIWHKVDKDFITQHSMLLSDKLGSSTSKGIEEVANEILKVYRNEYSQSKSLISESDLISLIEAIRYTKSRDDTICTYDNLSLLSSKLKSDDGMNLKNYSRIELSNLLISINENIKCLNAYSYKGIEDQIAIGYKQRILMPLYELRTRISNEISNID